MFERSPFDYYQRIEPPPLDAGYKGAIIASAAIHNNPAYQATRCFRPTSARGPGGTILRRSAIPAAALALQLSLTRTSPRMMTSFYEAGERRRRRASGAAARRAVAWGR